MTIWQKPPRVMTRDEVARIIERFVTDTGGKWEWDDFTLGGTIEDPYLDGIRLRSARLGQEFPPDRPGHYCSEAGAKVLRAYVEELRQSKMA